MNAVWEPLNVVFRTMNRVRKLMNNGDETA